MMLRKQNWLCGLHAYPNVLLSDKFMTIICKANLEEAMKAFLLACAGAVIIAVVSAVALNTVQESVQQAFVTTGVRL